MPSKEDANNNQSTEGKTYHVGAQRSDSTREPEQEGEHTSNFRLTEDLQQDTNSSSQAAGATSTTSSAELSNSACPLQYWASQPSNHDPWYIRPHVLASGEDLSNTAEHDDHEVSEAGATNGLSDSESQKMEKT